MRPFIALSALVLALPSGCGRSGPDQVPVAGKVTLDGKPLEGASITFVPDPGNPVMTPGGGFSGPEGDYTASHNDRPGLAPGKYKILVSKVGTKDGKPLPDQYKEDLTMAMISGLAMETLPPAYFNAVTTPLAADVGGEGGEFNFDVIPPSKAERKR